MKFYILKGGEYDITPKIDNRGSFGLNTGTSVNRYKQWFLECLKDHGSVISLDHQLKKQHFAYLLNKPDAIWVGHFPDNYYDVPRRHLLLSMSRLLISDEALLNVKTFPSSQVELLSTNVQIEKLNSIFSNLLPKMFVFAPKVDTHFFLPPSEKQKQFARMKQQIKEKQIHIVYAGRWIVTKGICQLIRMLDIWPISKVVLTIAGNIEEDNKIFYSVARHHTFSCFLKNEILQKKRGWLRLKPAPINKRELRELFWSADLFINPSFHPDENFGITVREAACCGLPVVTTNFGGLKPLADNMPWKGVDTYPTIFGLRFNLRQFNKLLKSAIAERNHYSQGYYRSLVLNECDTLLAKNNLKSAVEYLKNKPPEKPLNKQNQIYKTAKRLFYKSRTISEFFINLTKNVPNGSLLYGDERPRYIFPIIQGIYSKLNLPPPVQIKSKWRGFFRISIWEKERALLEWGFPGPRLMRYSKKDWSSLRECIHVNNENEFMMIPKNKAQVLLLQDLANFGYLIPDD
jgi:glycosyltransferase involved in cell wall biosynthesis